MSHTLNGWKAVARHLNVSVRAAQQWEKQRGLPVHRVQGGLRGQIWALDDELDTWLHSERTQRGLAETSDPIPPQSIPISQGNHLAPENESATEKEVTSSTGDTSQSSKRKGALFFRLALAAAGTIVALFIWGTLATSRTNLKRLRPARWIVEATSLSILNSDGDLLWTRQFPTTLEKEVYLKPDSVFAPWFEDLDQDGQVEVLFIPFGVTVDQRNTIYCFSSQGEERWRFRLGGPLATAKQTFEDAYQAVNLAVIHPRSQAEALIATVAIHFPSFPCQVAILSRHGQKLREYWHVGHIGNGIEKMQTVDLDQDGIKELLLGGTSNARGGAATMVILDPERLDGASVEESADFRFVNQSAGIEEARILFPKNCFGRLRQCQHIENIQVTEDRIVVTTDGVGNLQPQPPWPSGRRFEFDYQLRLRKATDGFYVPKVHRWLQDRGLLDHPYNEIACQPKPEIIFLKP